MASNVWVLRPEKGTYIRGSEIIEVRVVTSRVTSYGKEVERGSTVEITQTGSPPETLKLWQFDTRPPAGEAATALLAALSTDPCAMVLLDDSGKVRVQSLTGG